MIFFRKRFERKVAEAAEAMNIRKEAAAKEKEFTEVRLQEFKDFRDIGEEFEYLGITFIVTDIGASREGLTWYADGYWSTSDTQLICEYANRAKEIVQKEFPYSMLPVLKKGRDK